MTIAELNNGDESFERWRGYFEKELQRQISGARLRGCMAVGVHAGLAVRQWCLEHGCLDQMRSMLSGLNEFVPNLWEALTPPEVGRCTGKYEEMRDSFRSSLWTHIDPQRFVASAPKAHRDEMVDRQSLKELADTYLQRPWMQTPYLDWVFVDALIGSALVASYEFIQNKRWGENYSIYGDVWQARLALLQKFFYGWILPAIIAWWTYKRYPSETVMAAAAYYGISIILVFFVVGRWSLWRLRGGKSFRRASSELLEPLRTVYAKLNEETIHVPSLRRAVEHSAEAGVAWDPQLLCILDNVAGRSPVMWTRRFERSYG